MPRRLRFLMVFPLVLSIAAFCQSTLSVNSGINSSDTWVVVDMTVTNSTSITLAQPVYNLATKTSFSTLAAGATNQAFHVEAGYDSGGGLIMNFWPQGVPADPLGSDSDTLGFIRFAAGQMTLFDQSGAPMAVPSLEGIPTNWALTLLGSNPGPSVISNLVVSNIQNYSSAAHAQLAYGTPSTTAYVTGLTSQGSSAKWTYAQSGSNWVAQQVVLTPAIAAGTSTRTVKFTNLAWHDNATNDAARASKGYTAKAPPTSAANIPSLSIPSVGSASTTVGHLGGPQNVVFMHGFLSNGTTWNRMEPWLNQDFRFGTEITPSYQSISSLSSQGTQLYNDTQSIGGSGYILIGHSQGGLISRYAAQKYQTGNQSQTAVKGVITVDAPHQGADLVLYGPSIAPAFNTLGLAIWEWVGCQSQWDNGACFLAWLVYNAGPYMGAAFTVVAGLPDLADLTPGSSFLTALNSYRENFTQAAVVGKTPQRWNEARLTWDFLAPYLPIEATCDANYYPESWCGERVVASIVGITYDVVEALLAWAILEEIFDPYDDWLDYIVYYSGILGLMDGVDTYWNFVTSGGFYAGSDAIVQSSSQSYPYSTAIQYPINGSDSHVEATHSPYDHATLSQILAGPQFKAPTQGSCTFSASPSSYSTSGNGGASTFGLGTGSGCQWSAVAQVPWVTVTSGASGTSSGSVAFSVASNPVTIPRTGAIQVGNGISSGNFTINEAGACTYTLNPGFVGLAPGGGSATVTVATQNDCVWSAISNATWLTITSGASGTGSGTFTLTAAPGTGSDSFSATVTVVNQTLPVVIGSTVGTSATGVISITGSQSCIVYNPATGLCMVYSGGSFQVSVDGVGIGGAGYGGNATSAAALASNFANVVNAVPNSPVTAKASGATVSLTAKLKGAATDYSVSTSFACNYPMCFTAGVPAGYHLTGGTD